MLPLLPFIAIASKVFPDIIKVVAGDQSDSVKDQVVEAVKSIAGADEPATAKTNIEASPDAQDRLRIKLTEIALEATKEQNRAREEF